MRTIDKFEDFKAFRNEDCLPCLNSDLQPFDPHGLNPMVIQRICVCGAAIIQEGEGRPKLTCSGSCTLRRRALKKRLLRRQTSLLAKIELARLAQQQAMALSVEISRLRVVLGERLN